MTPYPYGDLRNPSPKEFWDTGFPNRLDPREEFAAGRHRDVEDRFVFPPALLVRGEASRIAWMWAVLEVEWGCSPEEQAIRLGDLAIWRDIWNEKVEVVDGETKCQQCGLAFRVHPQHPRAPTGVVMRCDRERVRLRGVRRGSHPMGPPCDKDSK
jgi:hypothetical protein